MEPVAIVLTTVGWLISTLISKAITALLEEWVKRVGLGKEFITLKKELTKIDSTLESARGLQTKNEALRKLLKDLQQLAYEADDLLDELDYYRTQDHIELYSNGDSSTSQMAGSIGSSSSSSPSGFRLASRGILSAFKHGCCSSRRDVIEQIRSSFTNRITMSSRMNELIIELRENGASIGKALELETIVTIRGNLENQAIRINPRETTSRMIERVFGREEEQENLINLIAGDEAAAQTLSIIAIVGHGGVGKTTLARLVYNDKLKVKTEHFDLKMWVTVSVNFDVKGLTREILQCASGSDYKDIVNLDKLQSSLEECLEDKRFLVVLDDVWEDKNADSWKMLLAPLKNSSRKGNVVLVTSRKPGIRKLDSTIKVLSLDGLEENKYWLLFKAHAFGDETHEGHQNLQIIGRDIARKLKGNPLAAKTVGALLKNDLDERHWRTVLEREDWKHEDGVNSIMPALRISYEYLPFHLQCCFSYCALFPKDFEFPQEFLVHLWIAQSFIHDQRKRLEDAGKKYLEYLVDFGFLEINIKKKEEPLYVMHDLLHDLAQIVSSEECVSNLDSGEIQEIPPTARHLSISGNSEKNLIKVENHLKARKLSTLLIGADKNKRMEGFPDRLKDARGLRVLLLHYISTTTLLRNPLNSAHLRYLFFYSDSRTLPEEICYLYHLQVLDVRNWDYLEGLPNKFSNLINLRHFIVPESKRNLHSLIASVGKLANIQELHEFKVGTKIEFSIEQLRELKELGKFLYINNLENVKSEEEAKGAGLIEKKFLNVLYLSWNREISDVMHRDDADVLEGLKPHPNLKKLKITGYSGATSATWLNSLTNLEEVHLKACMAWETLPPLGQLPLLKILNLNSMPAVREIGPDLYGCSQHVPFRCLQKMVLSNLPNLAKWVWSDQYLPALCNLSITDCPNLDLSILYPLFSDERVIVNTDNVELFKKFYLLESKLVTCQPSNAKAWDVVSFHNFRTITSLCVCSNAYPLSWDNLLNLVYLEELRIHSSVLFSLPNNKSYNQSRPPLISLKALYLEECGITGKQLTWVLHHVPMLSHLEVKNCHEIKSVGVATEMNEPNLTPFPATELEDNEGLLQIPYLLKYLHTLCFDNCTDMVLASQQVYSQLASLKRLEIKYCGSGLLCCPLEFEQAINSAHLLPPGLRTLKLFNISELTSLLLKGLSSLTELRLEHIEELESLDVTSCVALEDLTLEDCPGLASLKGLKSLTRLKLLTVRCSPSFADAWISASEDQGYFTNLEHLMIDTFSVLVEPICKQLSSLQKLTIKNEDAVCMSEAQEEALLLLTSLKAIKFHGCNNLQILPAKLHQLHSLEKLRIYECRNMQSPPENGLPKSVRSLKVFWCGPEVAKLFADYECGPEVEKRVKD